MEGLEFIGKNNTKTKSNFSASINKAINNAKLNTEENILQQESL
jgi:hypothetical protein